MDAAQLPVLGPDGEVRWIIHRVDDITEFVRSAGAAPLSSHADASPAIARRQRRSSSGESRSAVHRDLHGAGRSLLTDANNFLDVVIENIPAMIAVKDAKDRASCCSTAAGEDVTGIRARDSRWARRFRHVCSRPSRPRSSRPRTAACWPSGKLRDHRRGEPIDTRPLGGRRLDHRPSAGARR